jgi:6-pyruvoyltetrahydropterin/6-carboxytetrahydropterin synthase
MFMLLNLINQAVGLLLQNNQITMVYLTRVEHFNAAHRLHNKNWDDAKNTAVFGKCANPNWHGHNYELHVTIKGVPSVDTGYIFNAKLLSEIIQEHIIEKVDHKNLNLEVPFMKDTITSAENLCIAIWNELNPAIQQYAVQLHTIRLYETPRIYVEYFG